MLYARYARYALYTYRTHLYMLLSLQRVILALHPLSVYCSNSIEVAIYNNHRDGEVGMIQNSSLDHLDHFPFTLLTLGWSGRDDSE